MLKSERLAAKRKQQSEATSLVESFRNLVCTGPKYPGKPEDYRYVGVEYCVPVRSKRSKKAVVASTLNTRAELKLLQKELDVEYGKQYRDTLGSLNFHYAMRVCRDIYSRMIQPDLRAKVPDPVQRFDQVSAKYKSSDFAAYVPTVRHMALLMVRDHYAALLA